MNYFEKQLNRTDQKFLQRQRQSEAEHLPFVFAYLESKQPEDRLSEAVQLFVKAKGYALTEEEDLTLLVLTAESFSAEIDFPLWTEEGFQASEAASEASLTHLKKCLPGFLTDMTFEGYLDRYAKHFELQADKEALVRFQRELDLKAIQQQVKQVVWKKG